MRQETIVPHHVLRALAAIILCCTLTHTAVSQTAVKRDKQTEQPAKSPPKAESDDARIARERAKAERQQKAFDAKATSTTKSICSNC
jgi:hypothetical protein